MTAVISPSHSPFFLFTPSSERGISSNTAEKVHQAAFNTFVSSLTLSQLPARTTCNLVVVVLSESLILFCKKIDNALAFSSANLFFQGEGFEVAHTRIIQLSQETNATLSSQLTQTMNTVQIGTSPSDKSRWDSRLHARWDDEIATHPYFLISSKVPGIPFNALASDVLRPYLENKLFCHQIGKMIFLDALIGNRDRLNETICNGGNFLVAENGYSALSLIDHIFDLSDSNEYTARLEQYLSGKNIDRTVDKLLEAHPALQDMKPDIQRRIENGLKKAAADFIARYPNRKSFIAFLKTLGHHDHQALMKRYDIVHKKKAKAHPSAKYVPSTDLPLSSRDPWMILYHHTRGGISRDVTKILASVIQPIPVQALIRLALATATHHNSSHQKVAALFEVFLFSVTKNQAPSFEVEKHLDLLLSSLRALADLEEIANIADIEADIDRFLTSHPAPLENSTSDLRDSLKEIKELFSSKNFSQAKVKVESLVEEREFNARFQSFET